MNISKKLSPKLAISIILIIFASTFLYFLYKPDGKKTETTSTPDIVTNSTSQPDEEQPEKLGYKWRGQADEPKKLKISAINVDAFIQKVGVDQNNQVAVPTNIFLVGWFVDSSKPGENGLSIIDGHVDGRTVKDGVFARLSELKIGDNIKIILGDDTEKSFVVNSAVTVPNDDALAVLFSQDPTVPSQLNLVTCGGSFDKTAGTYNKRVIVSARLE
mgnify:CR=1 FL=1